MTSIVTDFKSIKRILDRQEQKAEFEAKNPKEEPAYLWPYGVAAVPYGGTDLGNSLPAGFIYAGPDMYSHNGPSWPREDWLIYDGAQWSKLIDVKI